MTNLSPAAQAVLDAHDNAPFENFVAADRLAVAAALRAAALHCKRDTLILLAIADELEQFAR
jgi:hypothetical protein